MAVEAEVLRVILWTGDPSKVIHIDLKAPIFIASLLISRLTLALENSITQVWE